MISLEEAREIILAAVPALPPQIIPLAEALGRVPAEDIAASVDLPPFDNSAMDGYAVRSSDLANADAQAVALRVIGQLPAGAAPGQSVAPGTCVRIFTGSTLPAGADAVVMQEDVKELPNEPGAAIFSEKATPWENVRLCGEDIKRGAPLIAGRRRLTAQELGLLAATGVASIKVAPSPVVGLLATGDELREPGQPLAPGQIYESNRITLASLGRRIGAIPKIYPIVPDTLDATMSALRQAFSECDLIATTGGVSVGEMDFVKAAFAKLGGQLDFWKVDIRPGRPFAFGQWNGKLLFGLPGNPVSAFVTFLLLVVPAIQKMQGADPSLRSTTGTLAEPLANDGARRHFMRVTRNAQGEVRSAGPQASHLLGSLAQANGLLDVPPNTTLPAGATVEVLSW